MISKLPFSETMTPLWKWKNQFINDKPYTTGWSFTSESVDNILDILSGTLTDYIVLIRPHHLNIKKISVVVREVYETFDTARCVIIWDKKPMSWFYMCANGDVDIITTKNHLLHQHSYIVTWWKNKEELQNKINEITEEGGNPFWLIEALNYG